MCRKRWRMANLNTSACIQITEWEIMWAALVVINAAGSWFRRTTAPFKAEITNVIGTTTSATSRAWIILITLCWRRDWRGRGRARVGRIRTLLSRIWWLHCNSTFSRWTAYVSLYPDVSLLTPAWSPWVLYNPVVYISWSITHQSHTMIQTSSTLTSKYTLSPQKISNTTDQLNFNACMYKNIY